MSQSKPLWFLAVVSVVIMGLAGWYIGTLGRPPEVPATNTAEKPPESAPAPLVCDLKKDWSLSANPNPQPAGTWSYNADTTPLPKIESWAAAPGISGWGESANVLGDFLPFICQTPADAQLALALGNDVQAGDIVFHATDASNSRTNAPATVAWQCIVPGTATITGSIWPTRNLGRTNSWKLVLRAGDSPRTLASGILAEGGPITRDNPTPINIAPFSMAKGDLVQLVLLRDGTTYGDFTAMTLAIAIAPGTSPAAPSASAVSALPVAPAAAPASYGGPALLISLAALGVSTLTLICVVILLLRQRSREMSASRRRHHALHHVSTSTSFPAATAGAPAA